jgi:adenosylmethionine-8-amino-7-oxononanoate aminotransferase
VIVRGEGAWLWDSEGRRYLDGNSSIWTNIHGHAHPAIHGAIAAQLEQIAHSSYLGFANPRASELAEALVALFPAGTLERVFFSDDGSTAVEVALKMSLQFRMQSGEPERCRFAAFADGYHGDTLGAAALGGVGRFFDRFRRFGPEVEFVRRTADLDPAGLHAVVVEPLIQGVNEMRPWPDGMLRELRAWCDRHGVLLILDEVMTGFGRTGSLFACQQEEVLPDFLCLAKGLSGGTLPLAATLTTDRIYRAFLGPPENAFYYGHSFTGNPLACAAALASLRLFEEERTLDKLPAKIARLGEGLAALAEREPRVVEIRQRGLIAGIELDEGLGPEVCRRARRHGLLTRPIRDTVVLMPPLCVSAAELDHAVAALGKALAEVEGATTTGARP